jgi:hypothetical protein
MAKELMEWEAYDQQKQQGLTFGELLHHNHFFENIAKMIIAFMVYEQILSWVSPEDMQEHGDEIKEQLQAEFLEVMKE